MTLLTACRKTICIGKAPLMMGILNVTPDSFSDGGVHATVEKAVSQALKLVRQGALIIDVGGESTRPGASACPVGDEVERVVPVIRAIRKVSEIPISVDTRKSAVAQEALLAGADMINDVSGGCFDPAILEAAAVSGAGLCLMHSRGLPENMLSQTVYDDLHAEIIAFLRGQFDAARSLGVREESLCLDPGIGFAKNNEQNLAILNELPRYWDAFPGRPLLIGHSRKRFLRALGAPEDPALRDEMTQTVSRRLAAFGRPLILRVHTPVPVA